MIGRQTARIGFLLAVCLLPYPAMAQESQRAGQQPMQGQDRVDELLGRYNLHPAFEKLGRGMGNALGGWLEIPYNVHTRYNTNDTASSFFTGLAVGITKGVVRTGVGVYETVTFFLPYPENYAPILPTLEYFKPGSRHEPLPLE